MARVHDLNVRKIVDQIAKHDREIKGLKNRKPGLGHSSIEDGTIHEYDADGTLVSQHGKQPDGTHNIVVVNGPKPPKPTEGKVTALPGLIEIRWNGKFAGDAVSPLDLKHVGAYVVPSGDFLDLSDQAGVMTGELGDVLQVQAAPGVYNVYLVAWSLAGKFSDAAGPVPVLVTVPADVDAINDALDDLNERYDGVITEAGNLGNRLDQAEHDLADHTTRLTEAEGDLTELASETLPQLETDLQNARDALAPLPGQIEANTTQINNAKTRLDNLDSTTLPGLTQDLDNAKTRLSSAETAISTTLPGAISDAQAAANMALLIAPVSTAAPTLADGTGRPLNSIWTRIDASGNEIGYWRWTASGWVTMAMTATVIPNLSAGKITTGTLSTSRLDAAGIAVAIASIIQLNADRITAGKLQASQIDVADLAAQIATVIELNASRITTGTLNADRLDANAVAAKVATVIQLNASRITAGTIATARLNTTEIAAQIATIINLNADRITAGTINVARLNVQAIAAATAAFQTVDVKNLFVTTGTMAEAVINKLWAEVVMSRKITTQMLAVGDFTNYAPSLRTQAADWSTSGAEVVIGNSTLGADGRRFAFNTSTTSSFAYAPTMSCQPGDQFYGQAQIYRSASATDGNLYVRLYWFKGDMTASATPFSNCYGGATASTPNASVVGGTVTAPSDAAFYQYTLATTAHTGDIGFYNMSARRKVGGEVVIDGSMKARHIDTEDLAASTGFIADLTSRIVKSDMFVGKEFFGGVFVGSYFWTSPLPNVGLKLDSQGMRVYGSEGGEPVTEIRADGGSVYSITDPATGDTLASLDAEGGVSGTGLNIEADPVFMGAPLLGQTAEFQHPSEFETSGLLDVLPRGMAARGFRNISDRSSLTNQEMEIFEFSYVHEPGRAYRLEVAPFAAYVGSGNAYGYLNVYISTDGTSPSMSDSPAFRQYVRNQASGTELATFGGTFYNIGYQPTTRVVRLLITIASEGGTMSFHPSALASSVRAWVEDMGLSVPDTTQLRNGRMNIGSTTPPAPPANPKENYTQVWKPAGYRSYDGSSHYTYADGKDRIYQGDGPATGMLYSLVTFGNGSKGQSITTALSGATINSIRVRIRFDHWYYNSGGTAQVMLHGQSTLPGSRPSMTLAATSTKWPKPGSRWVNIPSSRWAGFASGQWRGIGLGNGGAGLTYYGYARASAVELEIKYTK